VIERQKVAGECLRCALPADRKGNHRVIDCVRPIILDKETASYSKPMEYQKMKVAAMEVNTKEDLSSGSDSSDSERDEEESDNSSSSETEEEEEESEGEYLTEL